jgi:hypothetical protein
VAAAQAQHARERKKAFMCLVDGPLARLHLPHFLQSLKAANIDQQLVVYALDNHAAKLCQAVSLFLNMPSFCLLNKKKISKLSWPQDLL